MRPGSEKPIAVMLVDDHLLVRRPQDVGALGHEMHTAENDELRLGMLHCALRQPQRVALVVGEADHLIALVVMAQDQQPLAQLRSQLRQPAIQSLVRVAEVVLQIARRYRQHGHLNILPLV